jgi:hypothetical protein
MFNCSSIYPCPPPCLLHSVFAFLCFVERICTLRRL